jgi:hypothetical protein
MASFAGDIHGPPPETMATLIDYDRPVSLTVKESGPRPKHEWGNMLNGWIYSSKTQTLHSFSIAIFAGGTLFGTNRPKMEEHIADAELKLNNMPGSTNTDFAVKSTPDGRKVYYSGLGFGPGGAMLAGFASLPGNSYDLLVAESINFEDDMPVGEKLQDPAKPRSTLQQIFPRVEQFILNQIQKKEDSQPSAGPDGSPAAGSPSGQP